MSNLGDHVPKRLPKGLSSSTLSFPKLRPRDYKVSGTRISGFLEKARAGDPVCKLRMKKVTRNTPAACRSSMRCQNFATSPPAAKSVVTGRRSAVGHLTPVRCAIVSQGQRKRHRTVLRYAAGCSGTACSMRSMQSRSSATRWHHRGVAESNGAVQPPFCRAEDVPRVRSMYG